MCRTSFKTMTTGILAGLALALVALAIGPERSEAGEPGAATHKADTTHATHALASSKFAISNMTCPTCPITVKHAMLGVKGVKSVSVDFNAKTAQVSYDPRLTNKAAIAAASRNAGYPAKPVKSS